VFTKLRENELKAIPQRIEALKKEVENQRAEESALQARFANLIRRKNELLQQQPVLQAEPPQQSEQPQAEPPPQLSEQPQAEQMEESRDGAPPNNNDNNNSSDADLTNKTE